MTMNEVVDCSSMIGIIESFIGHQMALTVGYRVDVLKTKSKDADVLRHRRNSPPIEEFDSCFGSSSAVV